MAAINDIVISITRATASLTKQNWRPLVLGSSGSAIDYIIATQLSDLTDAGYSSSSPEYEMVSAMFAQSPRPEDVMVYRKASATNYSDALDTLYATHASKFRTVVIDSRAKDKLWEVGDWANTNKKFFFGCASGSDALVDRNVDREAYLIHDAPDDYPECAWVGQNVGKTPGSFTWKWKRLSGQVAPDFTQTQLQTIRTGTGGHDKGNALQEQAGATFVNEGQTTSGEFIDVIDAQDWIENEITVELLSLFVNNDKVSLDDAGIGQVEGVVRAVLTRAGDNKIIAKVGSKEDALLSDDGQYMFVLTVPNRADISTADRAARILPEVNFTLYLAGAVHRVEVNGKITV